MTSKSARTGIRRKRSGFSLIEVMLAMGIIATVMVPLIGLIGVGLDSMRTGHREVVDAEIVNLVANELSLTDWQVSDNLRSMNGEVRNFTQDGTKAQNSGDAVHAVKIYVSDDGMAAEGPGTDYARRVELRVTSVPESVGARFDDRKYYRRYSVLVARLDK